MINNSTGTFPSPNKHLCPSGSGATDNSKVTGDSVFANFTFTARNKHADNLTLKTPALSPDIKIEAHEPAAVGVHSLPSKCFSIGTTCVSPESSATKTFSVGNPNTFSSIKAVAKPVELAEQNSSNELASLADFFTFKKNKFKPENFQPAFGSSATSTEASVFLSNKAVDKPVGLSNQNLNLAKNSIKSNEKTSPVNFPIAEFDHLISKQGFLFNLNENKNSSSINEKKSEKPLYQLSPQASDTSSSSDSEPSLHKICNRKHDECNGELTCKDLFRKVNEKNGKNHKPSDLKSTHTEFIELDIQSLDVVTVDEEAVNRKVKKLEYLLKNEFEKDYELAWLLRAITCIDLTTLSGDDTCSNVKRLCYKAAHPLSANLIKLFKEDIEFHEVEKLRTAAVCVYPAKVPTAASEIRNFRLSNEIGVASVATGFPSGQYPLVTRLKEIKFCIKNGATEIDIVINREHVLKGKWKELFDEIKSMKYMCGNNVLLKTILATGECGSLKNVYKASYVAMVAGSDFIKTSTGKETVNATLQVGVVMCRAIKHYYETTGRKVGLKPAGGIRTSRDALSWLVLVKEILGNDWLNSKLFRIGASGLLGDIEKRLFYLIKGYQPPSDSFLFA